MRKCLVAVMMLVLVMATVSSMNIKSDNEVIIPIIHHIEEQHEICAKGIKATPPITKSNFFNDVEIATSPYDEVHPSVAGAPPFYIAAYTCAMADNDKDICVAVSMDNGSTFGNLITFDYDGEQDYPSLDCWEENIFYGTFRADPSKAYVYLVKMSSLHSEVTYWNWGPLGWYDIKEPEIACHNSKNPWEYGVIAFVASTTYPGQRWDNIPHMMFADPVEPNTAWISWAYYSGALHATADIDKTFNMMYCAYDWYNTNTGKYNIIVWKRSFTDPFTYEYIYLIPRYYNAICPSIVAEGNKIAIVCQSDENGNQDIICLYSANGGATWKKSFVVYTQDNEMYPKIVMHNEKLACFFVSNGNLYCSYSDDWGETWGEPLIVNDVAGSVSMEYRTIDACENGIVWTDLRNGNKDIYFDVHPEISFNISAEGGFGLTITITNSGTTIAEDQQWNISLSGLVFFNKESGGVIDELKPGESTTIKIIPIGIGPFDAKIKIYETEATISGFIIGPIVLL